MFLIFGCLLLLLTPFLSAKEDRDKSEEAEDAKPAASGETTDSKKKTDIASSDTSDEGTVNSKENSKEDNSENSKVGNSENSKEDNSENSKEDKSENPKEDNSENSKEENSPKSEAPSKRARPPKEKHTTAAPTRPTRPPVKKVDLTPCDKMKLGHDGCCRNNRHCRSPVPFLHCCCRRTSDEETGCEKNRKRKKCCKCHFVDVPGSPGRKC